MTDLGVNWSAVLPHLILCGMGSLILVGAAGRQESARWPLWAAVIGVVAAMVSAWMIEPGPPAFSGAVAVDGVSRIIYVVLALAALLTLFFTAGYGGRKEVESGEYYALVLFATAGMMAMAGGLDLVTIFIGLEVASISQYVLAAFRWHEVRSTEASVKYLLLGAFASGFLVYGIALIYGATGTTNLHEIAAAISSQGLTQSPLLLSGLGLLLVGLGFKMSAVPFHMWTPDVYQGAPTVVTAFMASGPKVAVVAALFRILFTGFDASRAEWGAILWWLAVLTMVVGNVLALVQRDMKRLLAYSAIAHAGYLLVALLAGEELGGIGILYYLVVYTLTTLGAFGVVALVRDEDNGGTAIDKFSGLGFARPWLGAAMAIFMFSLAGIPPAAGFVGKFYIFAGAVQAGQVPLAVIGVLASLVSIYYYLRVVVVMYMRPAAPGEPALIPAHAAVRLALLIAVGGILVLGVYPGPLYAAARAAVQGMAG